MTPRTALAGVLITPAQLYALERLHRWGSLVAAPKGEGIRPRTLDALVAADLARYGVTPSRQSGYLPTVATWADGFGTWHAQVPATIANQAAVARAAISGEVRAREHVEAEWEPKVEPSRERGQLDVDHRAGMVTWREVIE